jgi:hypothetical protein
LHGFPKDAAERYVRERTKLEKEKNEKEDELLKKLEAAKKRANFLKTYDGEWLE